MASCLSLDGHTEESRDYDVLLIVLGILKSSGELKVSELEIVWMESVGFGKGMCQS